MKFLYRPLSELPSACSDPSFPVAGGTYSHPDIEHVKVIRFVASNSVLSKHKFPEDILGKVFAEADIVRVYPSGPERMRRSWVAYENFRLINPVDAPEGANNIYQPCIV